MQQHACHGKVLLSIRAAPAAETTIRVGSYDSRALHSSCGAGRFAISRSLAISSFRQFGPGGFECKPRIAAARQRRIRHRPGSIPTLAQAGCACKQLANERFETRDHGTAQEGTVNTQEPAQDGTLRYWSTPDGTCRGRHGVEQRFEIKACKRGLYRSFGSTRVIARAGRMARWTTPQSVLPARLAEPRPRWSLKCSSTSRTMLPASSVILSL